MGVLTSTKFASRRAERRREARARIQAVGDRAGQFLDLWYGAVKRHFAIFADTVEGALEEPAPTICGCASDLLASTIACWGETVDLAHELCSTCTTTPTTPPGTTETTARVATTPLILFEIQHQAEAADPQPLGGVTADERDHLAVEDLRPLPNSEVPVGIPRENVRLSTYGNQVLVSLISLGGLALKPGQRVAGFVQFQGSNFAVVQVNVR